MPIRQPYRAAGGLLLASFLAALATAAPAAAQCSLTVNPSNVLDSQGNFIGNSLIASTSCSEVEITFEPGVYLVRSGMAHQGIDIQGASGTADVRLIFEASTAYYFNHEIFLSGFASGTRTVTVEGAGLDPGTGEHLTALTFCQDPPDCDCIDADLDPTNGCQLNDGQNGDSWGWGMLHLRSSARNVVVRDLRLESRRHDAEVVPPGQEVDTFSWEFSAGVMMCFDAGTSTCRDIVVDGVEIVAARYPLHSRNLDGGTFTDSRLDTFEIGYLAACAGDCVDPPQRRILVYGNTMTNPSRAGARYGFFGTHVMEDAAFVRNTIRNVNERGIYPRGGSRRLWIHQNTIEQAGNGTVGAGINLGQVGFADVLVSDNTIATVGDFPPPVSRLGGRPISLADELHHDPCSSSVSGTVRWPSGYWNGYGINTSGAVEGAVGLVGNQITDAATHGILVEPGADNVMVFDNEISGSGLNGLTVVPGFSLAGQFWYTPRGGVSNLWVQENRLLDNRRAGFELLPRIQPLFAVACTSGCRHAHEVYPLCDYDTSTCPIQPLNDIGIKLYDPATCMTHCLDPNCTGDTTTCGDFCFDPAWRSFQLDFHDNVAQGNGRVEVEAKGESAVVELGANILVDSLAEVTGVDASYSISGMDPSDLDPGWEHNYHLYVYPTGQGTSGSFQGAALPIACFEHHVGTPRPRSQNTAVERYRQLLTTVESCLVGFPYHDAASGWGTVDLWDDPRFPTGPKDFEIVAPNGDGCVMPAPSDACQPPPCGDWVITTSCTLEASAAAAANVEVRDNARLTIAAGAELDLDFSHYHLLVRDGSSVLIRDGGHIR